MSSLRCAFLIAFFCLATAPRAGAGGVVIVGQGGSLSYPTIQDAVDAAADGDVLLVGAGTFPGFTIVDRALSVFAAPGALVEVEGPVEVRDLAPQRTVVLSGLVGEASTPPSATEPAPGLLIAYCAGHVRVEGCSFLGDEADAVYQNAVGAPGVRIVNSTQVVLSRSSFRGGFGRAWCYQLFGCGASVGGLGLSIRNSTAAVYDCQLLGGTAGWYEACGGDGGAGAEVFGSEVWLAGTLAQGASGEWSCVGAPGPGGDGGHGLVLLSGKVHALDDTLVGGPKASGGQDGQPLVVLGGGWFDLPGTARRVVAESVVDDQAPSTITITGEPGDRVYAPGALRPGFRLAQLLGGWWLVPFPAKMPVQPLGTIPASGSLTVTLPVGQLPATRSGLLSFSQLYVLDQLQAAWIAAPLHRLALNHDGLPDCDANGVLDYLDAVQSPSLDCNSNLVLDACEVGAGTVPDCNANGIPDSCDIASGTSTDLNADGVPDECQPGVSLWVDAAAPAGGNGSAGAPYQALGDALAGALAQTVVVLVHDGTYVGPANRDLDFGGKDLLFRSVNGPAGCVIDLQGAGRLATLHSGEGSFTGFQGFTIRDGLAPEGGALRVDGADVNVLDCVIEGCSASGPLGGGAIWASQGDVVVRGSELRGNLSTFGAGGAVHVVDAYLELVFSSVHGNAAREGGAIALDGAGRTQISHSRLLENTATAGDGGALRAYQSTWSQLGFVRLVDSLVAGNHATGRGGALYLQGVLFGGNSASTRLFETTVVGNTAGGEGGAIFGEEWVWVRSWNSILWGNAAPLGSQIAFSTQPFGCFVDVRASDLQDGLAGIHNPGGANVSSWLLISSDPLFSDPDGPDNDPLTFLDNDYTLGAGSPCIDAGDSTVVAPDWLDIDGDDNFSEPTPFDLGLLPRQVDDPTVPDTGNGTPPLVDMGAHERQ